MKKYREDNKEKINCRSRKHYQNNIEEKRKYGKNYYDDHREEIREYDLRTGRITGTGQSLPEKIIEDYLKKKGFKIEPEKTFEDCRNKERHLLFFDFYIPYLNLIIEFDGIYHIEPIFGKENLQKIQEHDQIKNKFCKKNNINLLRIPYWEFDNIEQILQDYLLQLKQAA